MKSINTFKNGLNSNISGRTAEEIKQQKNERYQNNKEIFKAKFKEYYQNNKQKRNKKIKCKCGSLIIKRQLEKHLKTKKHQNFVKQNRELKKNNDEPFQSMFDADSEDSE